MANRELDTRKNQLQIEDGLEIKGGVETSYIELASALPSEANMNVST